MGLITGTPLPPPPHPDEDDTIERLTAAIKRPRYALTNSEIEARFAHELKLLGVTPEGRPLYLQQAQNKLELVEAYYKQSKKPRRLTLGEWIERELDTAAVVWRVCICRRRYGA